MENCAKADAEHARVLEAEAEARLEAERREAQTQQREALIQQMQRVRLTYQHDGCSRGAWDLARRAATIECDPRIQAEAVALLAGLDTGKVKSFPLPGTGLAFDPSGNRLMISGSSLIVHGPERPVQIWDRTTDELQTTEIKGDGVIGYRPDGTPLFLTVPQGDPSTAKLWDVSQARLLREFKSPVQGMSIITAFVLTPDGS